MSNNPAPGYAKHPDHKITITPDPRRVRILYQGETIADSSAALALAENKYPLRLYIPRTEVRMGRLTATDRTTYCPFKGEAIYWSVSAGGATAENAVWAYDAPYDEAAALAGHLAFYAEGFPGLEVAID